MSWWVAHRSVVVSMVAVVALIAGACGGADAGTSGQEPAADGDAAIRASSVDRLPELSADERAALSEAGLAAEGLMQGLPTTCRLAEGVTDPDPAAAVEQVLAALSTETLRGPLVAVDLPDDGALLAATLVASDGSVADTAVWVVDDAGTVTAANPLAAELTGFELSVVDGSAATPASYALAEATDCSWVLADRTHEDPPEPEPQLRPDLLVLDPATATPGELVAMRFPESSMRGVAFQLDRRTADGWAPVAWMTSDGNGGVPITVPPSTEGYAVEDVGIGGPGPDHVRLPDELPAGDYRVCTANAGSDFCAPLEVVVD
jgi:PAS domain-containing protein